MEEIISVNGFTPEKIMDYAAHAEIHSTHPIARSIIRKYRNEGKMPDIKTIGEFVQAGLPRD